MSLTLHQTELKGVPIRLLSNNPHIDGKIEKGQFYEQHMLDWIGKNEKLSGAFFDVGSNIGNHSIYAGKFLKDISQIVAFEPVYGAIFQSNMIMNDLQDRTLFFDCGLAATDGERAVFVRGGSYNPGATDLVEGSGVVVRSLDSMDVPVPGLIKIDVEGMEIEVLRGAVNLIKKHKPLLYVEVDTKDSRLEEFKSFLETIEYDLSHKFNDTPTFRCVPK